MSSCTAAGCGYDWVAGSTDPGASCCGDDAGEDLEGSSSCCYNAGYLADGDADQALVCSNGLLYDCGGATLDDSGLAATDAVNASREGLRCTAMNTWCPNGLTDCTAASGCETNLNATPGCASGVSLGQTTSVAGVLQCPACGCSLSTCSTIATGAGVGEGWYAFLASTDGCSTATEVEVTLGVPPDVDYNLYLYTASSGCSTTLVDSSTGGTMGGDETVSDASTGITAYWVEVRFAAGVSCASWTLSVDGGNCI
jgi:hypothetical protein